MLWPQPTPTYLGRADSGPAGAQEMHVTTLPSFGFIPERVYTMVSSTRLQVED